jgi:iturin family lipopeptide synthetase A
MRNKDYQFRPGLEVAVIGMVGRFPGAKHIDEFLDNLKNGIESMAFLSEEELKAAHIDKELIDNTRYIRVKAGIEEAEYFDASFFGYSARDAVVMDPQMRLFHECSWEALENAGYDPKRYDGLIGVYAGGTPSPYWEALTLLSGAGRVSDTYVTERVIDTFDKTLLNDKDLMSTRVSYKLDLKGPSFTLFTSCSTSLVAIHAACQGLLSGECDMALAGGVSVMSPERNGYLYREGMIASPDGHCRAFDAEAGGTVFGDGIGIVVLKKLEDALSDGDYIGAVVKGSAVNNDGSRKVGFTAPSVEGQEEAIRAALQMAQVEPGQIGYIEAHGTGTKIGDTIEFEALRRVFDKNKQCFCAVGSVKTNLGHLNSAAGVCGFIKTVLSIKHRLLFPTLNFKIPNPDIHLENTPLYINTKLIEWGAEGNAPLIAGVSAFGVGGTNAHIILGEPPPQTEPESIPDSNEKKLILMSAKTESALEVQTRNLVDYFKKNPTVNLADVAYTLQVGRRGYKYRRYAVCSTVVEALEMLSSPGDRYPLTGLYKEDNRPVVFMFPGVGAQYVRMGLGLYQRDSIFREEIDRCFDILESLMGYDIKEILYPTFVSSAIKSIDQAEISHPVIFAFEYALAKLLMKWGIKPYAMIGYSLGEYAVACLSGVFNLHDALELVVYREKLIRGLPPGGMLSVPLPEKELTPLLNNKLSIAIDNGPSCIISGPDAELAEFEKELKVKRLLCMRLTAAHPLHSALMGPILKKFNEKVKEATLCKPQIPYISNVTGDWIKDQEACDPGYWCRHLKETVQFARGIKKLTEEPNILFIEIGPGRDLCGLLVRQLDYESNQQAIDIIRPPHKDVPDFAYMLNKLGRLWLNGVRVDWNSFYEEKRQRLPLPTYPFERKLYRFEEDSFFIGTGPLSKKPLPSKVEDISNWFYIPSWKRVMPQISRDNGNNTGNTKDSWLIFIDECGLGKKLSGELPGTRDKIVVRKGKSFQIVDGENYTINPEKLNDYERLFQDLKQRGKNPARILHLWGVTSTNELDMREVKICRQLGFYSLIYQAKAIGNQGFNDEIQILVVSNQMQQVDGDEKLCPGKALVLGPVKIISQEYRNIKCRSIDIRFTNLESSKVQRLISQLADECLQDTPDMEVAYRGNFRWVKTFEPLVVPGREEIMRLRKGGVYLVTGGLGGIGSILANYLLKQWEGKVVLVSRSSLPAGTERKRWLEVHGTENPISQKILKVQELEAAGQVLVLTADVSDRQQMEKVFVKTEQVFGPVNGVIHAAGITGVETSRSIKEISDAECEEQFKPKIQGILVLEEFLRGRKPDFCLLTSSLSPILGGLGYTAYASANLFMDAFVREYNREHPVPWISVNWETWQNQEKQSRQNQGKKSRSALLGASNTQLAMTPEEGVETFRRILSWRQIDEIVVSSGNLQTRIDQWTTLEPGREDGNSKESKFLAPVERGDLTTPYAPPGNRVEQTLVEIWETLFQVKGIGIHDDFFELGGGSLKAINFLGIAYREFNREIPISDFFNKPTIQGIADHIKKSQKTGFTPIQHMEQKEYYPLSSAQLRLYILQQMETGSTAYNESQALFVEGIMDKKRLEETFLQMIKRHENLRTSFHMIAGEPVQVICMDCDFILKEYPAERDFKETLRQFIQPFDLSRPPLMRGGLIKWAQNSYILMFDMHHIITDGSSEDIFNTEFMRLYAGEQLSPPKIQYKDYAAWQKNDYYQKLLKLQETFWLEEFPDEIPAIDLPTDFHRPEIKGYAGSHLKFCLDAEETRVLKRLAVDTDTTFYMLLLSVFFVFLSKLSGQEDIVVGTPVAGRKHPDLAHLIGVLVNTLAIRDFPNPTKTFRSFLQEVKQHTLRIYENQEYPFENLVDKTTVSRDISRNPLFDVMFLFAVGNAAVEIEGLRLTPYDFDPGISNFDLTLMVADMEHSVGFTFQYSTDLFLEKTMQRFFAYFKKTVSDILQDPGQRIADIQLITMAEKEQILYVFNNTAAEYPKDKTIHQLFAEQALKSPDRIAIVATDEREEKKRRSEEEKNGGVETLRPVEMLRATSLQQIQKIQQITYHELNNQSDHLAGLLIEKGVLPDTIVAIMTERSIEMIIGILGILKAGGAYLPIDPDYPRERIDYMLKESGAKLLVVANDQEGEKLRRWEGEKIFLEEILKVPKSSFVPTVPSAAKIAEGVYLRPKDANSSTLTSTSTSTCQVGGANLAYIIYTSGSTGRPKGVMAEHQGLVNYIWWAAQKYVKNERINFSLYSSISFDLTVTSLFTPLITGNEIVIYEAMDKEFLIEKIIDDNRTAVIKLTPSHLKLIKEKKIPGASSMIKRFIVGGEKFGSSLARDIYDNFDGKIEMYNEYGPTEAVVGCMIHKFDPGSDQKEFVPIGIPINNTRIYILDKYLNPVPIGVPGEISIGGHGLARGYLNRTEFTSEQFIENPFIPGQKIYKSGDFACWLPDGNIQFIGRIDQQVKIRGFRIEIEEIECRLLQHEEIKDATIIAKKSKNGDIDLWAYLVSTRELTTHELKEYLGLTLPGYMIPSYFVSLEKMPITSGGKVDKKMLASIAANMKTGREFVPAQTDLQKKIASIWQEVLGITSVSITDNFFDLGGNSLKLITLNRQLNEALEMNVPVVEMFKYTTIETFLDFIETRNKAGAVPAIDKERITDDLSKVEGLLHGAIGMLGGK